MKTTILGMTTAIAFALPAIAQTGVEDTVRNVLDEQGYAESSIDMLSEGQIAEVYLTATSESPSDVETLLQGYSLGEGDTTAADVGPSGVEDRVAEILEANGYSSDMVSALSGGDIANIYLSGTSGDPADVQDAIGSAIETSTRTVTDDPSAAEERALTYLEREGYSTNEIDMVSEAELVAIYVALTSGDNSDISEAVSSALEAS